MKVKSRLVPDAQGFLTQECPYCNRLFKVAFGQGSRKHPIFCPYCGIEGHHGWFTMEQLKYLASVAQGVSGQMPVENPRPMPVHQFACHGDRIKHRRQTKTLYCITCGRQCAPTGPAGSGKGTTRKPAARKTAPRKPASRKVRV
jgi:hypothetical protein